MSETDGNPQQDSDATPRSDQSRGRAAVVMAVLTLLMAMGPLWLLREALVADSNPDIASMMAAPSMLGLAFAVPACLLWRRRPATAERLARFGLLGLLDPTLLLMIWLSSIPMV